MTSTTADDDRFGHIEHMLGELLERADQPTARWMSVASAAVYSDTSEKTVRRWLESGKLVARRPCGKILIDRSELDAFISTATTTPHTGRGRR